MDVVHQFSVHERTNILESKFFNQSSGSNTEGISEGNSGEKGSMQKNDNEHIEKFRNTGRVGNDNKGHIGQQVTVRTPANIQAGRKQHQQSPRKWTRLLSQEVGISRATVQRVIHTDLHLFPYKVLIFQKQ